MSATAADTSFVARQLAVSRARREMLDGTARRAWAPNGPPPSNAPPPSPPARDLWLLNAGGAAAASELHEAQRKLDAVLEANVVAEAKCGELRHALAQQTQELERRATAAAAREQEYLVTIARLQQHASAGDAQLSSARQERAAETDAAWERVRMLEASLEAAEERARAAEERALAAEEAAEERVRLVLAERVRWSTSLLDASREADAQANARVADAVAEAAAASGSAPVSVRAALQLPSSGGDSGGDGGAGGAGGAGGGGAGGAGGVGRWLTVQLESMEAHRRDLADLAQSLAAQQAALDTARGAGDKRQSN